MLEKIKEFVELNLEINDISTKCRRRKYVDARALFFKIAKDTTNNSLSTIGKFMGGRDHATVLHNINNVYESAKKEKKCIGITYNEYVRNLGDAVNRLDINKHSIKELIFINDSQLDTIRDLQSRKDLGDANIKELVSKYNDLTEEKKELFLLRTSAILKMI